MSQPHTRQASGEMGDVTAQPRPASRTHTVTSSYVSVRSAFPGPLDSSGGSAGRTGSPSLQPTAAALPGRQSDGAIVAPPFSLPAPVTPITVNADSIPPPRKSRHNRQAHSFSSPRAASAVHTRTSSAGTDSPPKHAVHPLLPGVAPAWPTPLQSPLIALPPDSAGATAPPNPFYIPPPPQSQPGPSPSRKRQSHPELLLRSPVRLIDVDEPPPPPRPAPLPPTAPSAPPYPSASTTRKSAATSSTQQYPMSPLSPAPTTSPSSPSKPLLPPSPAEPHIDATAPSAAGRLSHWRTRLGNHLGSIKLSADYVLANNRRNYRSFVIGLLTVFLVVFFLTLVQNALVRSSIVFVKLSEDTVGQYDLLLTPTNMTRPFLNYTSANASLASVASLQGAVPRWLIPVNVTSPASDNWDPSVTDPVAASAYLLVIDSSLEEQIGVGVAWPHRALGDGEAHVTGSLLRSLRKRPNRGDRLGIRLDLAAFLGANTTAAANVGNTTVTLTSAQVDQLSLVLGVPRAQLLAGATQLPDGQYQLMLNTATNNNVSQLTTLSQEFTIVDAIDKPQGKYPQALGNVIVLDRAPTEVLLKRAAAQIAANPVLSQSLNLTVADVRGFRLADYAMSMVAIIKDRVAVYTGASVDRQRAFVRVTDAMAVALGLDYPADVLDVLNQALKGTQFIQIFMNEIFFTVIAVLSLLAVLLIYALLLADVEEKTFEYGMLRSLGMQQASLIGLLMIQSLYYSIPGIVLGLIVCLVFYVPVEYILSTFASVPIALGLDTTAWSLGLVLGLVLPVLGMLVPIRRALSQTLRDALDVYHNVVFDSVVTISRLRDVGINLGETVVALLFVVIGFLVYYVIPLSFTFGNLGLFFRILTVILLAMVVGQVLIGQVLQHLLELVAMRIVMVCTRDRYVMDVVAKNLSAHVKRNGKTALMFTLCLAYIIFAAVMFRLQADTLSETLEWNYGADISIDGVSFARPLPEARVSNFLASSTAVAGFTYLTFPLTSYYPVTGTRYAPMASLSSPSVRVMGIHANFLDVALTKYYIPVRVLDGVSPWRVPAELNGTLVPAPSTAGSRKPIAAPAPRIARAADTLAAQVNQTDAYRDVLPVVISEALANRAYIGALTNCVLQIDYKPTNSVWTTTRSQLSRPLAVARKVPSLTGISRLTSNRSPLLVSMDHYARLLREIDAWAGTNVSAATSVAAPGKVSPAVLRVLPDTDLRVPKQSALVRLRAGMSPLQIEGFINELNTAIGDDKVTVDNLNYQLQSTALAAFFINVLFYIVAFVGILLSFFVLWLSFTANLRENAWEFGVLRAIGLDAGTVIRLYIYEAVAIVLATILLGTTIGIVTAVTLTLQFNLFTEMPFSFNFPTGLYTTVVVLALVVSVAGSWAPAREYAKKKIAIALKGL
ncbi:hypothetical protein H9P43_007762 [Blastocladiella emersonii ATCC 22665]|nr:hypothetical protein H9P43_007762 [Blastocladiella emersonii ATCC 22665]